MLAAGFAAAAAVLAAAAPTALADVPTFNGAFTTGQPISNLEYPLQSYIAGHVTLVTDPTLGQVVAAFAIGDRDQPYSETYAGRGDLLTPNVYPDGSTSFTAIPVQIPAGLPAFHGSRTSFFQFAEAKDTRASAPGWGLGLLADANGVNHYLFAGPSGQNFWLGPVVDGAWHTFTVQARYSTSATGWVSLYMDGQLQTLNLGSAAGKTVTPNYATITDGASAWPLDVNSYRSSGTVPGTLTIYHGAPEIGPTLASVGSTTSPPPPPTSTAAFSAPATSTIGATVQFAASASTGSPVYVGRDRGEFVHRPVDVDHDRF